MLSGWTVADTFLKILYVYGGLVVREKARLVGMRERALRGERVRLSEWLGIVRVVPIIAFFLFFLGAFILALPFVLMFPLARSLLSLAPSLGGLTSWYAQLGDTQVTPDKSFSGIEANRPTEGRPPNCYPSNAKAVAPRLALPKP